MQKNCSEYPSRQVSSTPALLLHLLLGPVHVELNQSVQLEAVVVKAKARKTHTSL